MINKIKIRNWKVLISLIFLVYFFFGFTNGDNGTTSSSEVHRLSKTNLSGKLGDSYRFDINNISLPMNNKGILAAVNILPGGSGGQFGNNTFLFSGGFFDEWLQ